MYEVACNYSSSKHAFAELLVKPYKLSPIISQKSELSAWWVLRKAFKRVFLLVKK